MAEEKFLYLVKNLVSKTLNANGNLVLIFFGSEYCKITVNITCLDNHDSLVMRKYLKVLHWQ